MKKLVVVIVSAGLVFGAAAPTASASPWVPPFDPTSDPTRPVLRWVPKVGPSSSVGSVREVRKPREVRKAGDR